MLIYLFETLRVSESLELTQIIAPAIRIRIKAPATKLETKPDKVDVIISGINYMFIFKYLHILQAF